MSKILFHFRSKQLIETADFMYILPPYRFTSYAIGILTGFTLRKVQDIKITSTQLCSAWMLIFAFLVVSFRLAAELTDENYKYNAIHAAVTTLLPIPWCVFFVLAIFTSEMKYSSEFWDFLRNLINRLSYLSVLFIVYINCSWANRIFILFSTFYFELKS